MPREAKESAQIDEEIGQKKIDQVLEKIRKHEKEEARDEDLISWEELTEEEQKVYRVYLERKSEEDFTKYVDQAFSRYSEDQFGFLPSKEPSRPSLTHFEDLCEDWWGRHGGTLRGISEGSHDAEIIEDEAIRQVTKDPDERELLGLNRETLMLGGTIGTSFFRKGIKNVPQEIKVLYQELSKKKSQAVYDYYKKLVQRIGKERVNELVTEAGQTLKNIAKEFNEKYGGHLDIREINPFESPFGIS